MEKVVIIEKAIKDIQSNIDYLCILDAYGGDHTDQISRLENRIAELRAQLKELEK